MSWIVLYRSKCEEEDESPAFFGPMNSGGEAEAFALGMMSGNPTLDAWPLEIEAGAMRLGPVIGGRYGVVV